MGKITLTNIAEELAARSGVSKDITDNFIRAVVDAIEKGLLEDNLVKIKGLGTFKLTEVSERGSVDVNTGERITIKGYRKVTFTPDSAMKEFVNRPFAHFEPTELNEGYPADDSAIEEEENPTVGDEEFTVPVLSDCQSNGAEDKELKSPEKEVTGDCKSTVTEDSPEEDSVAMEEDSVADSQSVVTEERSVEESTVEEGVVEEPSSFLIAEDRDIKEAIIGEEHEDTIEAEAPVYNVSEPKDKRSSRKSGLGWVLVLLLLILVGGTYYLTIADQDTLIGNHDADTDEYNDMMAIPNLEEELSKEWGDKPKVKKQLKTKTYERAEDVATKESEKNEGGEQIDTKAPSVESEKAPATIQPAVVRSATDTKFCSVILTESLETKTVRDITPSDTTDYVIDGTLVTHELKNGETIIQLAKRYYGDKRLWPYIVKYNEMKDYNNVAIGQEVNIPVLKNKE